MSETHRLLKSIGKEAFELLEDGTRRRILLLLRDEELTVKDIAQRLNVTPQNVYHHLRKLIDAGLVIEIQEKRTKHLIESYFTATADTFVYHEDEMYGNDTHSFLEVLNGLNEMGLKVAVTESNAKKLAELNQQSDRLINSPNPVEDVCGYCSFSGLFMKFGPMNPKLLSRILYYNNVMSMSDEKFEESLRISRDLRGFLNSIKVEDDSESQYIE